MIAALGSYAFLPRMSGESYALRMSTTGWATLALLAIDNLR